MKVCLLYSGYLRSWKQCRDNHEEMLRPWARCVIHVNENNQFLEKYEGDKWGYNANKAPETVVHGTMNMWANMAEAFNYAPEDLDVYVRIRYDILLSGLIDFTQYKYNSDTVYIPFGNDFREGVNDQFAFGNWEAMRRYFFVNYRHHQTFAEAKMFHSESYLKHNLDSFGMKIVRIPIQNTILRV